MKTAIIKVRLAYDFPDEMSIKEIKEKVENLELPKEYDEDSFEWSVRKRNVDFIASCFSEFYSKGKRHWTIELM